MTTLALTFGLMLLAVLGMALGVIVSGRRLSGSCGGIGGPDCACDRAGRPRDCEQKSEDQVVSLPSRRDRAEPRDRV